MLSHCGEFRAIWRFEEPFEHWVSVICHNEAYTLQRQILGRAATGPRRYISWEELLEQPVAPVIQNLEHRDMLNKAFDRHKRLGGIQGEKSCDAIDYAYRSGMTAKEIAFKLDTTPSYVNQLISHDYLVKMKLIATVSFKKKRAGALAWRVLELYKSENDWFA